MSITCPKCSQVVESTDGFCESCGFKINDISSGSADSLTPQQQQEQQQQPSPQSSSSSSSNNIKKVCKNKLCTNYNVEYGIDENYCGMCGSELVLLNSALEEEAEPPDLQKKRGFLLMPDRSQIEITPTQRLIGRIDLSKYISEDDMNHVSRGHITVFKEGEKYYVQDGKTIVQEKPSKNKTWLLSGGQKEEITEKGRRELNDGDEINIADTVTLLFAIK
jgi:FHA domain-containing protein